MSTGTAGADRPGRRIVLEPVPPGFWAIVGGAIVAALAPLFGFLVGSMIGLGDDGDTAPLFLALIVGILVGGAGVGAAVLGARRYLRHRRAAGAGGDTDGTSH
ncbi:MULTISPECIES: hypothetical protein [Rhodococcus]|nr:MULTISPECIES: hypothetical protein [Rhodococcus]